MPIHGGREKTVCSLCCTLVYSALISISGKPSTCLITDLVDKLRFGEIDMSNVRKKKYMAFSFGCRDDPSILFYHIRPVSMQLICVLSDV